ncbi:PAS domain S-box protein [Vacuolonema iberomarrocanum]|uniref:PAS domain S-box protein n=1 Tax=Vacuolonema iberomarrocanum TaxID=3454632 RepID=UPI003F6DD715
MPPNSPGSGSSPVPSRMPLRVIFIVTVISQLIAAVGLVGYLSFRNGQKAVSDLASQLRRELSARIERELQGYFAIPHDINRLNADAFARGDLDVIGGTRGESQLYQQIVVSPTIAFVYCGSEQSGEFFGVLRSPDDGSVVVSYGNAANQYLRNYYRLDVSGNRTFLLWQADTPFDARTRPWYRQAAASERAIWTDIYIAFTTGLPNITAALPVYDRSGRRLLGVCATDVVLPEEFRSFLRNLEIGQNGQAFLIDRDGDLISTSTDEPLMIGNGEDAQPLPAHESSNELVRESAQYLLSQFGSFDSIRGAQQLDFKQSGQRQFLQVVPFRDRYGLDWLIVVVVPETDFMAQIHANNRNTLLLCLITAGVAIAIGILTARWITRPILKISQAADRLAKGDQVESISPSPVTELDTLASSFNRMTGQLKSSFDALRIAEENYRSIFENALEGIFQSSPEGEFISVNPAMAKIYGYDSPQEMIESITNIGEQLYVDPEKRAEFKSLFVNQDKVQGFEYRCYCKDGEIIWTQIDARAVRDSAGNILYYEGLVQDITQRKQREDELRKQLEELKIEIDHKKREEEVATLTASTYFQEVKQEMAEVNLDEFWS